MRRLLAAAALLATAALGSSDWNIREGFIERGVERLRPADDGGIFWVEERTALDAPLPSPRRSAQQLAEAYGLSNVIRCRIVDYVDCSGRDHDFVDDGASRVIELIGDQYRITDYRRMSWFSYYMSTAVRPGRPHLLVAQLPNDAERETTITITHPVGESSWAAPFAGEELYIPESEQPDGFHPDVGVGVFTGRQIPTDGKPYLFSFLFYPKTSRLKITVSHAPCTMDATVESGGAVARMWVLDVLDPLAEHPPDPPAAVDGDERLVGIYQTHPWFFYAHYGYPSRTRENRVRSLRNLCTLLRFCGMNYLEFNAVNGSDVASCSWFDSEMFEPLEGDLLDELMGITDETGIRVVPGLASLPVPPTRGRGELTEEPNEWGYSLYSLQRRAGGDVAQGLWASALDPARPEVRDLLIEALGQIIDRCGDHPSLFGVHFRVNGNIGLCYLGREYGYSDWDVAEFGRDSDIVVPEGADPYAWLQANAREEWTDWRCRKTAELWLAARDYVRGAVPGRTDLKLVVKTVLPGEGRGPEGWAAGRTPLDLLREHGFYPRLFEGEEGIIIEQAHILVADRFSYNSGAGQVGPLRDFYFEPSWYSLFDLGDRRAVEFYHVYWEEVPHPDNEYGDVLRTATTAPWRGWYYEAPTFALRQSNADIQALFGWERALLGHESDLRRYTRALRSLPITAPEEFDGTFASDGLVWVRRFGPMLAVADVSGRDNRCTLDWNGLPPEVRECGRDLAVQASGSSLTLELTPFELRVLDLR